MLQNLKNYFQILAQDFKKVAATKPPQIIDKA